MTWRTLSDELAHLEATDPDVARAAANYHRIGEVFGRHLRGDSS